MTKEENVIRYYGLCNTLKKLIRTGWKVWHVSSPRLESVAEHIYGTQMLALAMKSEYNYDIDIMKVILMLSVHELEEIIIGDLTQFQINSEVKTEIGHEAIEKILEGILDKNKIKNLILEFDERETPEAKFAYYCDKLECDLQSKLYDEIGLVNLNNQEGNETMNNDLVQSLLNCGRSWSEMWLLFGQKKYNYDDNFLAVSNYALNNNITSKYQTELNETVELIKKRIKK